jgi:hypothetical protein
MSLRRFMHRTRKDEDLAEEIESHLAHAQDANDARGLSGDEARRQARLKFGNPRTTREATPSAWDDTEKQNPAAPAVRDDTSNNLALEQIPLSYQ